MNTNKRLEQLFGITRSMRGGNLNFDCLDLHDHLADYAVVQWIYAEHPEWQEPSRRLNSSADRKHTRSWRGDTKVDEVNLVRCWSNGKDMAIRYLKDSGFFIAMSWIFGKLSGQNQ